MSSIVNLYDRKLNKAVRAPDLSDLENALLVVLKVKSSLQDLSDKYVAAAASLHEI